MRGLRSFCSIIVLLFALLLTACGGSNTSSNGSGSGNTGDKGGGITPAATSGAVGETLHTASATVKGKTVTLLTNAKGMTLYYFTPDTATTTACTGGCASAWPPYLVNGSDVPASASQLPGKLTVQTNANGHQVEYNGHPLYTYTGDTAAGQTNGEGVGGKWFVATTDLATSGGSASSGSNYGNGNAGY